MNTLMIIVTAFAIAKIPKSRGLTSRAITTVDANVIPKQIACAV
jgi:hypothetical protein